MTLTKEDKVILKAIVKNELAVVKEEGEKFKLVNSPVLSSIYRMKEMDLKFLATESKYIEFLEELLTKL